jgi:mono/diheme cytochrome c family protein
MRSLFPCALVAVLLAGCPKHPTPGASTIVRQRDAAAEPFGIGRTPTAEEIRAWDVDVLPDGTGLPEGKGTAAEGAKVYASRCATCHGAKGQGGTAIPLVAGKGHSRGYRIGRPPPGEPAPTLVDFYPYATTLFDYTRRAMPWNAPGSLRDDETYGVVAFVLNLNGLLGEDDVLDSRSLPRIKMPALARFAYEEGQPLDVR